VKFDGNKSGSGHYSQSSTIVQVASSLEKVEYRHYNTLRDEWNGQVKLSKGFLSEIRWYKHTEIEQRQ
jgi:hypothetical protein